MPDPRQTAEEQARSERRREEARMREPRREPEQPRIVEEHPVIGPYGEQEIEAVDDRGRRWTSLRPRR